MGMSTPHVWGLCTPCHRHSANTTVMRSAHILCSYFLEPLSLPSELEKGEEKATVTEADVSVYKEPTTTLSTVQRGPYRSWGGRGRQRDYHSISMENKPKAQARRLMPKVPSERGQDKVRLRFACETP